MKIKISISMEEELDKRLEDKVKDSIFRNKSHLIEYAVKSFLKKEKMGARR
ncbi:MAG: ribbon-helix-helix protein, CopG family [Candidatus Pacearchaeota archaeon]